MIPTKLIILMVMLFSDREQVDLNIQVNGIKQVQGSIMVAVYDSPDTFLGDDALIVEGFAVQSETLIAKLKLPQGKYAVSVFHDLNSDHELNTNILGIPKEPFGFSNDAKGSFGPPDFEKAMFECYQEQQTININLIKVGI